mmetsp:Transcript_5423/g.9127  ORF Transcript_5423/g.9127 Transcript_5423/m.9127 type:complete len:116 (+) Transcript_5423:814-1161(+)
MWNVKNFAKSGKEAWVSYDFAKPILLRGYAIRCAKDDLMKSPAHWVLSCIDFLPESNKHARKERKIHKCENSHWNTINEIQQFNLKQVMVTSIKLKIYKNNGHQDLAISEFKVFC